MEQRNLTLEHAIYFGDVATVEALLERNPDLLNESFEANIGLTPLMWACRNRRDSIVATLLRLGADVHRLNKKEVSGDGGNTALWFCAQGEWPGTVGIAERLLDAGASLETRCEYGSTAFWIGASWCHLDLLQFLLARGANAEAADDRGQRPLAMLKATQARLEAKVEKTAQEARFIHAAPQVIAWLETVIQ